MKKIVIVFIIGIILVIIIAFIASFAAVDIEQAGGADAGPAPAPFSPLNQLPDCDSVDLGNDSIEGGLAVCAGGSAICGPASKPIPIENGLLKECASPKLSTP